MANNRFIISALAAVISLGALSACTPTTTHKSFYDGNGAQSSTQGSADGSAPASPGKAMTLAAVTSMLDQLTVAPETRTRYQRSDFMGNDWNKDAKGCKTRTKVLAEESLTQVTHYRNCAIRTGKWESIFDGKQFTDPQAVTIDHMVPLLEAWDSGANQWSFKQRNRYGNDLAYPWGLVVETKQLNEDKGHSDPSEWMPPREKCAYLAAWVGVKWRWNLTADRKEIRAIKSGLAGCSDQSMAQVTVPAKAS